MSRTHPDGGRIHLHAGDQLANQIERSIRQRLQAHPVVAASIDLSVRLREKQLVDGHTSERADFIQISVERLPDADSSKDPMQVADRCCRAAVDSVGLDVDCPPILEGVAISHFNFEVEVP